MTVSGLSGSGAAQYETANLNQGSQRPSGGRGRGRGRALVPMVGFQSQDSEPD